MGFNSGFKGLKMLIKRAYTHYKMGRRSYFNVNIQEWASLYE